MAPTTAAGVDNTASLQDPKVRLALQQLIKKYNRVEQQQKDQQVEALQVAQDKTLPQNSALALPAQTGLQNAKAPIDSQNSDSPSQESAETTGAVELAEASRFAEGEELILGIEIGAEEPRSALADVFAFKTKNSVRVGFATLIQLLELPINFNTELTRANGWLFNENNAFKLTVDSETQLMTVDANGNNWQLGPNEFQQESDDLYVDMELIAQWLGLTYQIDESRLKMALTSKRQLPVELRIARRSKEISPVAVATGSVMPYRETGYKLFTPPLLDAQVGVSQRSGQSNAIYSISGAQDLAYLTGKFYFSGGRGDLLNSARLTFARESDKNDLLGPLKATEFEFGDIQPVASSLGTGRNLGRGLRFSNIPLVSSVDGQLVSFVGEVADGWDVELYRNGVLLDQEFGIDDGRYDFNDVQLDYGINEFELVFYGPQGQVETRTETYNLDSNTIKKGDFNYQFSVIEANESVFPLEEQNYQSANTSKGLQTNVVSSYGLFDWLSLNAGSGLFQPDGKEDVQSHNLGLSASLFGKAFLSTSVNETRELSRQTNHDLRTQLLGQNFSFNYRQIESLGLADTFAENTEDIYGVAMSGQLFRSSDLPVSYQNEWRKSDSYGQKLDLFRNSLGIRTRLGSFSHALEWRKQELEPGSLPPVVDMFNVDQYAQTLLAQIEQQQQQELQGAEIYDRTTSGSLQYRNSFHSVFTRVFANYSIEPESELSSYGVSLSYPFTPDVTSNFSLFRYQLTKQTSGNLGVNWRLDNLYLSASTSYSTTTGWSGGLNARFGFGVSEDAGYFSTNSSVSQAGAVTARVFEDTNLNGIKDENEPVISGAEVMSLQGGRKQAITDEKGVAVVTGLSALQTTDIVVDRASFEDATMKTLLPGVAIMGRKGRMEHIEFAATSTGELEGTLYLGTESGEMLPAAYAQIQLVNEQGKVVDTAQSEFDGYYLFVDVLPGKYKVMIDKSFTSRRNLRLSDPLYLGIRGGEVVNGKDIMLARKEEASGYAAELGEFSSLTILKAYWRLVTSSGMNVARLRPFYLQDEGSGKYVLRAAFSQDQDYALRVCERIKARSFKCVVNELTTNI
jgi:hypothetical protein